MTYKGGILFIIFNAGFYEKLYRGREVGLTTPDKKKQTTPPSQIQILEILDTTPPHTLPSFLCCPQCCHLTVTLAYVLPHCDLLSQLIPCTATITHHSYLEGREAPSVPLVGIRRYTYN